MVKIPRTRFFPLLLSTLRRNLAVVFCEVKHRATGPNLKLEVLKIRASLIHPNGRREGERKERCKEKGREGIEGR